MKHLPEPGQLSSWALDLSKCGPGVTASWDKLELTGYQPPAGGGTRQL